MSNEMDVRRLITEVHKRPQLWDVRMAEYKDRTNTLHYWNEIAEIIGVDVEHCKRKWKNLRDAYRAEVRRTERRIARFKALGQYDPLRRTTSKWVFFEPMSFINESKRTTYSMHNSTMANISPTLVNEADGNSGSQDLIYEPGFHTFCDIKMETHHTTDDDDDDEEEDDKLFEEFNAVATPQAARRLSDCIATAAAAAEISAAAAAQASASASGTAASIQCKCTKRADDQVHFLEDLEREEKKLMQSTRKEITRANSVGHVGDADYNFLVSFLPQMKKMSELQNLQFRAKMSELLLMTMSSPPAAAAASCLSAAAATVGFMHAPLAGCGVLPPPKLDHQEMALKRMQLLPCGQEKLAIREAPADRGASGGSCTGGTGNDNDNGNGNGNDGPMEVGADEEQQQQVQQRRAQEPRDMKNGSATATGAVNWS